jgi:serine protease Do
MMYILRRILFAAIFGLLWSQSVAASALPDFTQLVAQNAPAVVNISTVGEPRKSSSRNPGNRELDEFFRQFRPPNAPRGPMPSRSLGSGFIVSDDGYILTNNHVVDGASEIIVRFNDRRELVATLVGQDPRSDLAVLKVETDDKLPTVTIGKSETLKVGEWVLAIGSPFGFDYSVTAGIVSAKGRSLPTAQNETYVPYIQTDVAINPGNSGGPLFNLDGRVVGINAQIYSNSGGFMGVSFAIPIDVAMEVADQLRDGGRVSRGWLGVVIQEVNRDLAESFGLDRPHGALISRVMDGTPAQLGGLREGDIITKFNGHSIERSGELPQHVGRVRAGNEVEVELVRDGEKITMGLEVGELSDLDKRGRVVTSGPSDSDRLGLGVVDLSEEELSQLDIEGGVRVEDSSGAAEEAGIRPRDIILRLNNRVVMDRNALVEITADLAPGKRVPVLVLRNGNTLFVPLHVPE